MQINSTVDLHSVRGFTFNVLRDFCLCAWGNTTGVAISVLTRQMTRKTSSLQSRGKSILDGLKNALPSPRSLAEFDRSKDPNFLALARWLPSVSPEMTWHWPHLSYVRQHLDLLTSGETDRLMVFCPPRHGKTELVSVRYPAWRLGRNPATRVILGSYNQSFANKISRKARKVARQAGIRISKERNTAAQWETLLGGGGFRACGVGSPPMGEGADLLVIDDPFKSREEADSPLRRERVWEWYSEDLLTRLEPRGQIILINARWHQDDLSGRILESAEAKRWKVVSLPAISEDCPESPDPIGRPAGEPLCVERRSLEELEAIRTVMGEYGFAAAFQQHPQAREGGKFKLAYFTQFEDQTPANCTHVRYWDKAATPGGGCYSCGTLLARGPQTPHPKYYVVDVWRKQVGDADREASIKQVAEEDRHKFGKGLTIGIEQEGGSSGKWSAHETIKMLAGFQAYAEVATGSKEERAGPFAAQCGAGNVVLIRGAWNKPYIDELCAFPTGTYADQVDASSGAFKRLTQALPKGSWGMWG